MSDGGDRTTYLVFSNPVAGKEDEFNEPPGMSIAPTPPPA